MFQDRPPKVNERKILKLEQKKLTNTLEINTHKKCMQLLFGHHLKGTNRVL